MKDSEIDKISALTVTLIGKRFDRDSIGVIVEALEAGAKHQAEIAVLTAPPEELEEAEPEPEPVIIFAPVFFKGFFRRGT